MFWLKTRLKPTAKFMSPLTRRGEPLCRGRKERMKKSRRNFLQALAVSGGLLQIQSVARSTSHTAPFAPMDRAALVRRHDPVLRQVDPLSPLSVGNGEFAFTADVTGLQTFPEVYEQSTPLCTMSQWGWHRAPLPAGLDPKALRLVQFDTFGRQVGYAVSAEGQNELYNWLRENPHRLHLGRVALRLTTSDGREAQIADITNIEQRLDLWTGALTSRFKFEGKPVTVRTAVHPAFDLLAVSIESQLIAEGRLAVRFAFPYGSPSMQAADWTQPERHKTELLKQTANSAELRRQLDADQYFAAINWKGRAEFTAEKPHHYILAPAKRSSRLEFTAVFSPSRLATASPATAATFTASAAHWNRFWTEGGAIRRDRNGCRRVVARKRKEPLSPERPQLAAKEFALLLTRQWRIALRRGDDGCRLARRSNVTRARFSIGRLLDCSLGKIELRTDTGNLTVKPLSTEAKVISFAMTQTPITTTSSKRRCHRDTAATETERLREIYLSVSYPSGSVAAVSLWLNAIK
jgi:hypothetical protein